MFKKVKEKISMLRRDMEDAGKKSMPDSFLVIWVWRLGHSVYQPLVSWLLENWLWRTDQELYFRREIDRAANTLFWMEVAQLGNHRPPSSCWGNSLGGVRAVWVLSLSVSFLWGSGVERENGLCGRADPGEQRPKGWLHSDIYFTQLRNWDQWEAGSAELVEVVKSSSLVLYQERDVP